MFLTPVTRRVIVTKHLQRCSVCIPPEIFLISKFGYLLFSNASHETKTVNANRWETANSHPPGPIELFSNQEQVLGFVMPFTTSANCAKVLGQNHFAEPHCHAFIFFIQC